MMFPSFTFPFGIVEYQYAQYVNIRPRHQFTMNIFNLLLLCLALHLASPTDWTPVDNLFLSAIDNRTFPGGIVSIATSKSILYQKAYGTFTYSQDLFSNPSVTLDTKYDIASLTKVTGTLAAVLNLYESKRLNIDDLVTKYIPDYDNNKKRDTTLKNLLLHNAGLPADAPQDKRGSKQEVMDYIITCKLENPVGTAFVYSDLSFILLGDIVQRITKRKLDDYIHQIHYSQMTMRNTLFNPNATMKPLIAPTQYNRTRGLIQGSVHDPTSYLFGGVAGHAGIFSTVNDLTRYMRIWLSGGQIPGQNRIFSNASAQLFTAKVTNLPYNNTRALGWDTVPADEYPPCGHKFSANSFGHTGFTGTSVWADKQKDLIIVILTNRVHPRSSNRDHIKFRSDVSDTIVGLLGH